MFKLKTNKQTNLQWAVPVNPNTAFCSGQVLQALSAETDPLHWQNDFVHVTAMHTDLLFVKLAEKLT